jgi:hypothetical protein
MLNLSTRKKRTALERAYRVRVTNARLLLKSYRSKADFARALGVSAAFVGHICGDNPIRAIGERLARDIEQKLGLTPGWLDQIH